MRQKHDITQGEERKGRKWRRREGGENKGAKNGECAVYLSMCIYIYT